jgi:hypothetical protein
VEHAHRLTDEQLSRGALVARLTSSGEYARQGLGRGVHYVFVDSAAAGWRSVIVAEDLARPVHVMKMTLFMVPHLIDAPAARFFESGGLTFDWIRCGKRCCIPCTDRVDCPSGPFLPFDPMNPAPAAVK